MKSSSKELIVGAIFLVAIIIVAVFTIIVSDWNLFGSKILWRVKYDNVRGLKKGDEVRVAGIEIGKVKKLRLDEGKVIVTLLLRKPLRYYKDGRITIENVTPLGGKFVNIDVGDLTKKEIPITEDVLLDGENPPEDVATSLNKLVEDIREGRGTLGRLLREDDIYRDVQQITQSVKDITRNIRDGKGLVGKFVGPESEKLYEDVEQVVASIRKATDQLSQKKGTLAKIIYDDALYTQLDETTKSIQAITKDLQAGKGTIGKLLTDDAVYNNVRDVTESIKSGEGALGKLITDKEMARDLQNIMTNVSTISGSISRGEGSLGGRLMKDRQLYDEATKTMTSIRSITEKIASGEGTVGKLIYDQALYTKIDRLVMEVTKATEDIREAAPITAFATLLLAGFR